MKEAESRLHMYKYYIPFIVNSISECIKIDPDRLSEAFTKVAERHVKGEISYSPIIEKEDKITGERIDEEIHETTEVGDRLLTNSVINDNHIDKTKKKKMKLERKNHDIRKKIGLEKDQLTLNAKFQKKTRRK
jgi:hypothetical protein